MPLQAATALQLPDCSRPIQSVDMQRHPHEQQCVRTRVAAFNDVVSKVKTHRDKVRTGSRVLMARLWNRLPLG